MTEGVHYKIDFITFARLFGFNKDDREADVIHFEAHMNHSKIVASYEYDELADGSTTALKSVYYVLNNMFRETIYPKGRSDSTSLRRFAPNLIVRLLPGAQPFSVSRFVWFNLVEVTESGKCNLPYAPYIMYMIEMVSGVSFKKDVEHASYQVKQWQHQKKQQVVEEHILKKDSSKQHKTDQEEGPSKAPVTPDFRRETRYITYVCQDLQLTTLIRKTRRSLTSKKTITTRRVFVFRFHRHLTGGDASLRTPQSRCRTLHHCSLLNSGKQGWVHLWLVLNKWGKMQGYQG
jgi:hypothetical protein